ncbi:hypothetical protein AVEN_219862-1 [Araneus ventricosus]|uniref:Uncharacterized protein n=1 Tax=Araneus ventricosus TaxID=182803 RepID=A0A4Y2R7U5_ARAVE|nr:hypothetical protein AVEN_29784-1 [Araneus ventricosus]GBN71832.1 hypothetical protein AVEN_92760-1 [Araneus ventricosus]GBN72780.1 hypothetical protein AVEN_219862-1 [Araneus ventricosus]
MTSLWCGAETWRRGVSSGAVLVSSGAVLVSSAAVLVSSGAVLVRSGAVLDTWPQFEITKAVKKKSSCVLKTGR